MSHDVDLAYAYSTCRQIVCFVSPNANLEGKQTRRADRHRIKLHTNLRFDREDVQVIWHYYGAAVTFNFSVAVRANGPFCDSTARPVERSALSLWTNSTIRILEHSHFCYLPKPAGAESISSVAAD
jgi:hypothetical protein